MVKVTSKIEKLKELEKKIEEAKESIHSDFGELMISKLEIDYDLLERKKDIEEVVERIILEMNSNPFSENNNEEDNIEQIKENNSYEQQNA